MNVSFKPESSYVGDAIPYYENGKYYVYYLDDPRSREPGQSTGCTKDGTNQPNPILVRGPLISTRFLKVSETFGLGHSWR